MSTIIFDFDGTIADSLETVVGIYRELAKDTRKLTEEEFQALRKLPAQKVVKAVGMPLWRIPFLMRRGRRMMHDRLGEIQVFEDLPQVLQVLEERGYVMRIVTSNSEDNVRTFLERHNLTNYFVDIHGGVGLFSKARVLRKIVKTEKLDQKEVFYVGDEARDITASKKAGLKIVSVTWGYNHQELLSQLKPYALVEKPQDLLEVFPGK